MNDLPDDLVKLVAERFRLLGDGTRLRIIRFLLARGEAPVGEIAAATGCSQANVSKHLRLLHDARVVRRRAEGSALSHSAEESEGQRFNRSARE